MYDVTQEYGIYKERQHVCVMLNSCVSNAHRGCVLQYSHDKVVQMYDMFNYGDLVTRRTRTHVVNLFMRQAATCVATTKLLLGTTCCLM
mgnify:CR=1 FL=1